MTLQEQLYELFDAQMAEWPLAQKNYEELKQVQTKTVDFGRFAVKVQFNPARMVSSGAKVDAKTIAARPCFLCEANRPAEQKGVPFGDYTILVNPFPIFPHHFTIPLNQHQPQQILPYIKDMLSLAEELDDFVIFYNGPKCGASAPDHMHFQAGDKDFLPVVEDYRRLKTTIKMVDDAVMFTIPNYLRTIISIETDNKETAEKIFQSYYKEWQKGSDEPMMNVVCYYEINRWIVLLIPRGHFRPWQYAAEPDKQLLVSPATVEMSGIFITPVKEHFEKINKQDVESIFNQTTVSFDI